MGFLCGFLIFFLGSLLIYDRLTRKYLNPYRLYLVFGKKGSGKSTYLVKMALKYSRRGWTVYSNMPDLAVPGVRLIDIEQLGDFVPVADSVLLLDEVGMIWDSRDFKRFKNSVRDFFKLQRHYRCIVYMASQTFDVDKKIRDLCDGMYLHINIGRVFSMGKRIEKSICLTEATADSESRISENLRFRPFWSWTMTLIPRYAKFFDSHVLPDMPELPYTVPVPMIERGGFLDTSHTQQNKNFVEFRGVSPSKPRFWHFRPFWDWLAPTTVSGRFLWIIVLKHLQLFVIFCHTMRPFKAIPAKLSMNIFWT